MANSVITVTGFWDEVVTEIWIDQRVRRLIDRDDRFPRVYWGRRTNGLFIIIKQQAAVAPAAAGASPEATAARSRVLSKWTGRRSGLHVGGLLYSALRRI